MQFKNMKKCKSIPVGAMCWQDGCDTTANQDNRNGWHWKSGGRYKGTVRLCPSCAGKQGYRVPIWTHIFNTGDSQ